MAWRCSSEPRQTSKWACICRRKASRSRSKARPVSSLLARALAGGRARKRSTVSSRAAGNSAAGTTRFDQAVALGGASVERLAEEDELLGPSRADEAGQPVERQRGDQALLDRRQAEERILAGQAVVAHQSQLQTAAQTVPVDPGHDEAIHPLDGDHRVFPRDEIVEAELRRRPAR